MTEASDPTPASSMLAPWAAMLTDPAVYAILGSSLFLVWHGSERSAQAVAAVKRNEQPAEYIQTMSKREVLLFPVVGSFTLLLIFFLFEWIQFLLIISQTVMACSSVAFLISPLVHACLARTFPHAMRSGLSNWCTWGEFCSIALAVGVTLVWMYSGHWLLVDILGFGICVVGITFIQIPNVKLVTLLFVGLLLYDVFWVFFSERWFHSNVMVEVATKEAANPMVSVAKVLHIPKIAESSSQVLELPVKLIFPNSFTSSPRHFSMLGLGDIVIPGLLVALVRRIGDTDALKFRYFQASLIGYFFGVLMAIVMSRIYGVAQPALLYLVPSTLLAVGWATARKGEFHRFVQFDQSEEKYLLPKP
ncbi:signal peptide peptidase [Capsaspora owczarzaki ATCC 30864]|uniref:Signal peptide peptidase n=1 Tax=Capsaspora owczarzaki (strain ATCC 30864) TaxID=595528 RepID=A0A0D2UHV7_CAPO3|nr:signal peptide peptidase [Capsaspora owczarzaki ATCC 30864]KJE94681.1 signal peptide peptidase [Capsaspora owczarzaki ATCC 30864]|eukprot:XP_004346977.1 signal peptide peptidase [Capsaspora owczarzaki ATCC 30864]